MNDNELITVDDRVYVSPDVSLQETNDFINNLRQTQQSGVAEIEQQTRDLGSDLPPSQGGISGASGAFVSRYQTPAVSAAVADLRAAAQASALNTLLQNEISQKKKAYNNAYKAAKKRAAARANAKTTPVTNNDNPEPDVVEETPTDVKPDQIILNMGRAALDEQIKNNQAPGQKKTVSDTIDWSKYLKIGR